MALSRGDKEALRALKDRLTSASFCHSTEEMERDIDHAVLQHLETLCQSTLLNGEPISWAMAQWGELSGTPVGEKKVDAPRTLHTLKSFEQINFLESYGCTVNQTLLIPAHPVVTLSVDNDEGAMPGQVNLSVQLNDWTADELLAGSSADNKFSLYFNPEDGNGTEGVEAWQNLISAPWTTANEINKVDISIGLQNDPDWPDVWRQLVFRLFPFDNRLISIPIEPLIVDSEDKQLVVKISLGDDDLADQIIASLQGKLRVNVVPICNQFPVLVDNYNPNEPLELTYNGTLACSVIPLEGWRLFSNGQSYQLSERRSYSGIDVNFGFDLVHKNDGFYVQTCSPWQESIQDQFKYLIGFDWNEATLEFCATHIDEFGRGALGCQLLTKPIESKVSILEQLTAVGMRKPVVVTNSEIKQVVLKHMPPQLRSSMLGESIRIENRFATSQSDVKYATPITHIVLSVSEPKDSLLLHQAQWLEHKIRYVGIPFSISIRVILKEK